MGSAAPTEWARPVKTWMLPTMVAVLVVSGLIAINAMNEATITLAITFGFIVFLMIVMGLVGLVWRRPNTVSVARNPGSLVFTPPTALAAVLSVAAGLAMLSLARLWSQPELWTHLPYETRGAVIVGPLIGVFMTVEPAWSLRRPAGLGLDAIGMRGVRGGPRVALRWEQVTDVKVTQVKKAHALVLMTVDGPVAVRDGLVSGDVHAVATVVSYYLQNPDERVRLSNGIDAVRHVDSEVLARRFSAV